MTHQTKRVLGAPPDRGWPMRLPRGRRITYQDGVSGFVRHSDDLANEGLASQGLASEGDAGERADSEPVPLLLVHGWTATADINFATVFETLEQRYSFVAPDLQGHGRGPRRPHVGFRLVQCAKDAVNLLDAFGIDRAIIVGYSMGGAIAQLVWRHFAERVAALVLCATASTFRDTPAEHVRFMGVAAGGLAARLMPTRVSRTVGRRYLNWYARRGLSQWMVDEMRVHEPVRLIQAGHQLGAFDSRRWKSSIDVPVASVVPAYDQVVPPERQLALAKAIVGAKTFPIEGGHIACLQQPEAWLGGLSDALAWVEGEVARCPAPPSGAPVGSAPVGIPHPHPIRSWL